MFLQEEIGFNKYLPLIFGIWGQFQHLACSLLATWAPEVFVLISREDEW